VEVKSRKTPLDAADIESVCGDAGSLNSDEGETRIVQVIHGSVAEFFLCGKGFCVLDPSLGVHALGAGHLCILTSCLDYIAIPELDRLVEGRKQRRKPGGEEANRFSQSPQRRPTRAGSEASFGSSASNYASSGHLGQYKQPEQSHNNDSGQSQPFCVYKESGKGPLDEYRAPPPLRIPLALQQYLEDPKVPVDLCTLEKAASDIGSHRSEENMSQLMQDSPDFLMYVLNAFSMHAKYADKHGADPGAIIYRLHFQGGLERWLHLAETLRLDTTLLYFAAEHGLVPWIKYIIPLGQDPDVLGGEHNHALIAAVINGHTKAITLLLEQGASLIAKDGLSKSALHHVAEGGMLSVLDCLCESERFQRKLGPMLLERLDSSGQTPLHLAVKNGHLVMTERLLSLRANPNMEDVSGKTLLHSAAEGRSSSLALCQLLLDSGASKVALTNRGNLTPSQLALQEGYLDRISLIVDFLPSKAARGRASSQIIAEVRLISLSNVPNDGQLYIKVVVGDEFKTLYPDQTWPDNPVRRKKLQIQIGSNSKKLICENLHWETRLTLHRYSESHHIYVPTNWHVRYIRGEKVEVMSNLSRKRPRGEPAEVTLEVIIPPELGT
jgi:ankyrin repeat protein